MDGRGVEAVILCSPHSLAHYGGTAAEGALLVVTAREARWVRPGAGETWALAAALLPRGCALGHDGDAARCLGALVRLVRPRRVLCLAPDIARQVGGA